MFTGGKASPYDKVVKNLAALYFRILWKVELPSYILSETGRAFHSFHDRANNYVSKQYVPISAVSHGVLGAAHCFGDPKFV